LLFLLLTKILGLHGDDDNDCPEHETNKESGHSDKGYAWDGDEQDEDDTDDQDNGDDSREEDSDEEEHGNFEEDGNFNRGPANRDDEDRMTGANQHPAAVTTKRSGQQQQKTARGGRPCMLFARRMSTS
jgi:hypothetical protein